MSLRPQPRQHQLEQRQLGRSLRHPRVCVDTIDRLVLELGLDEVGVLAGPANEMRVSLLLSTPAFPQEGRQSSGSLPELHHEVVERSELGLLRLLGLDLRRRLGRELLDHGGVSEHEGLVLLLLEFGETDGEDDFVLQIDESKEMSQFDGRAEDGTTRR